MSYCKYKFVFVLLALSYLFVGCSEKNVEQKPNILVLLTDDQRYGTIEELHQEEVVTPNLDRLVKGGVSFSNAYIFGAPHGAVCSPSRAMLMTGKYYFNLTPNVYAQFSVPGNERGKCDTITFPEYFKANGYETFATGKQHNGSDWVERGFDKGKALYLGGMTKHFGTKVRDFDQTNGWSEFYADQEKFSSEVFADAAIDFIDQDHQDKPFMMYVAFTAPHDPRTAPEEFHEMYPIKDIEVPANFMPGHPFKIGDMKIRDEKLASFPRTKEGVQKHISDYHAMITATDVQIGRILDELKKSGKADNTIIVFSGDNGLALGQHGLIGKQNVYEHSIKVPLVFCGPGIPENVKTEAFAYLHDVFPTLCDLSQLEIPETVETLSLEPVLKGDKDKVREVMHFGYNAWVGDIKHKKKGQDNGRGALRAVRKGDFKLILSSKDGVLTQQLFNLKNDPWELKNLADEDSYSDKVEDLKVELQKRIDETGDPAQLNKDMFGLYEEYDATHELK
ncbi:sulfatase-like hydrolase/transferase [Labilibaculum sp.]|uniref:sulfatase-like hydrolase/transferase n=1 Tax=Labilibaculum sp. TaxID=2060723 RepID=UPI00356330E3